MKKVPVVSWGDWKAHSVQVRLPVDRWCSSGQKAGMGAETGLLHIQE